MVIPPSDLAPAARAEFDRLCEVLDARGLLERADPSAIADAARVKDLLDRCHLDVATNVPSLAQLKSINLLHSQRRGHLRELGLTLMPSRVLLRVNAKDPQKAAQDPLEDLIKLHA
jgi:hypothetical protein